MDSAVGSRPVRQRGDSLALAFVAAGANAFIGCTAVHNPEVASPLHVLFFDGLLSGLPPAKALWQAKQFYARGIQRDESLPKDQQALLQAAKYRTSRAFLCLGLGW